MRSTTSYFVALAIAVLGCGTSIAGYNVQANAIPGALDGVKKLAIGPASCPPNFDCVWLETKLAEEFARLGRFALVDAKWVRQAMLELGIDRLNEETRPALAERLGVDAFVVPIIGHSGTESAGMTGFVSGGVFYGSESLLSKGGAELVVVRASDGKVVIRGSGFGESEFRSGKGVVLKVYREIIERTFGPTP